MTLQTLNVNPDRLPARSLQRAPSPSHLLLLWGIIAIYAVARASQLFADRLPALLIVILHILPPAVFAIVHGSIVLGRKRTLLFAALCLGAGSAAEILGVRTGFPFGRYHFTDLMGPKILDVPILLSLAHLGIAYCAWIMSVLILGFANQRSSRPRAVAAALLASLIMTSWDLAMDPDWSTIDHAWIWHDGGAFFGVPVSNFLGWFGTAFVYYLSFAFLSRGEFVTPSSHSKSLMCLPPILYALCALGNLLSLSMPMAPPVIADASGKPWSTAHLLTACAAVSLLGMMTFALVSLMKLRDWRPFPHLPQQLP